MEKIILKAETRTATGKRVAKDLRIKGAKNLVQKNPVAAVAGGAGVAAGAGGMAVANSMNKK